ncbi:hypothetical protein GLOIN_2v1545434, partial [Rhizophagus irregularis DAOM 181602=DAOM 197198]
MSSRLPNECYQQIFSNVQDTKTLFSIIQVNHTWCENAIIFLWKNPFRKEIDYNHTKIIPVLLSFLKKDKNTFFDYPSFITHLDFDNLFRITSKFYDNNENEVEYFMGLMEQDDTLPSIFSKLEYDKWPGFGQIW